MRKIAIWSATIFLQKVRLVKFIKKHLFITYVREQMTLNRVSNKHWTIKKQVKKRTIRVADITNVYKK